MNRTILQLLGLTFCFAVVQALECYNCEFGFKDLCFTSKKTCADGEHCFSGKGHAVAGLLEIMSKGCIAVNKCNDTYKLPFPTNSSTTVYEITRTCCDTNLCNGAPAGLPGALQLALVSVAAVFATNALV